VSRLWTAVLSVTLVVSVAMSFVGPAKEGVFVWDLKGFFAVYGFVGCVVIIFVSKWLGRYWLQREENYYDPHQAPAEAEDVGEPGEEGNPSAPEGTGTGAGSPVPAGGAEARGGGENHA
jgi:hypothetical protein